MKYNVSDIIDFNAITTFQYFSSIIFAITVIIEIFYGIIVYLTTTKKMQFFRILTFIYIFECIFVEFTMLCWKPVRLFPFAVLYPTGLLAPMSSFTSTIFATFFPLGHFCFIETFATIIIERHFRILGHTVKVKNARFWIYFLMAVSFLSVVIAYFLYVLQNIDDEKVQKLLKAEIEGIELILDLQPSLYLIDYSFNLKFWIFFFFCAIYATVRLVIFNYILKENFKFVKNAQKNISEKTRKQFTLMLLSTITQCLTTMFFVCFAGIWVFTFYIGVNATAIKYAYYISLALIICYPVADVITVLIVVKGYRNTLKKMFKLIKGKTNERISSLRFQNNAVYNKNFRNHSVAATTHRKDVFVY